MQPELLAKRIRSNLLEQKEKLEDYLKILDAEKEDILQKDADKLLNHISIEKEVINELSQLKVILEPLEVMYRSSPYKKDESLNGLKNCIEKLSKNVQEKAEVNTDHLSVALDNLKKNMKTIRSKTGYTNRVYTKTGDPRMVDLKG